MSNENIKHRFKSINSFPKELENLINEHSDNDNGLKVISFESLLVGNEVRHSDRTVDRSHKLVKINILDEMDCIKIPDSVRSLNELKTVEMINMISDIKKKFDDNSDYRLISDIADVNKALIDRDGCIIESFNGCIITVCMDLNSDVIDSVYLLFNKYGADNDRVLCKSLIAFSPEIYGVEKARLIDKFYLDQIGKIKEDNSDITFPSTVKGLVRNMVDIPDHLNEIHNLHERFGHVISNLTFIYKPDVMRSCLIGYDKDNKFVSFHLKRYGDNDE